MAVMRGFDGIRQAESERAEFTGSHTASTTSDIATTSVPPATLARYSLFSTISGSTR
jgi:hypothetical protein